MELTFNIDLGVNFAKQKALDGLELTGAIVSGKAKQNVQRVFDFTSGNLEGQIFYYVDKSEFKTVIVANAPYARIQELGGDIKPKNAKALAVPIHPDAKRTAIPEGKSIRDIFPDLVLIKRKNAHPLLVRTAGRGFNHGRFDIMYVLVSEVTLKAKPYLRPALYESKDQILKAFGKN